MRRRERVVDVDGVAGWLLGVAIDDSHTPIARIRLALTEDEFVVTARGEEAVVGKEARVVERVHVGKTADTRTEHIEETERRRDVDVQPVEERDLIGRAHPRR